MKTLLKPASLALGLILAALSAPVVLAQAAPAAPAPLGPLVPGLGVANLEAVVANSDAYRAAGQQRPVTYKAVYDSAQARALVLDGELKVLADRFTADRAAKKPEAMLQQQYVVIQAKQEAAKEEIQRMTMPIALSEAYVVEQIEAKLDTAVRNAMTKRRVSLLVSPQAVILGPGYDITPAIVAEINLLIPTAQLVPPAGWEPRQVREARAAQGGGQPAAPARPAAPGAAPAPRPAAGPQPEGR